MPTLTPGAQTTDMTPQANQLTFAQRARTAMNVLMGRTALVPVSNQPTQIPGIEGAWMGPNQPLQPIAPQDEGAGVVGRRLNYQVGFNLQQTPRWNEPVSFANLRFLADNCDVLRLVIETRKDQMEAMDWQIVPKKTSKVKPDDASIVACEKFFKKPCPEYTWSQWLRAILEDMFVLDAVALYVRKTRGGDLYSLDIMDGATIKPLIDATGRRPEAPLPAYQQILMGVNAADYSACGANEKGEVDMDVNELIYKARNVRSNKFYGFGPVEQIIVTTNIAIRRSLYQLNYYTAGNVPDALVTVPTTWNPKQIKEFQDYFDELLTGNLAQKRKMKFIPGGMEVKETTTAPQKDPEYDEWLARIICYAFSVSPQAFVKMMNRATGETAATTANEEGIQPVKKFIKGILDEVIEQFFGDEIEFSWMDSEEANAVTESQVNTAYVKEGILTRDEVRIDLGRDALGGNAARLQVTTAMGTADVGAELNDSGEIEEPADVIARTEPPADPNAVPPQLDENGKPVPPKVGPDGKPLPAEAAPALGADPTEDPKPKPKTDDAEKAATAGLKKKGSASRGFMEHGHSVNAVATIRPKVADALTATGKSVAKQVEAELAKADEDPEDRAKRISDAIDLGTLAILGEAVNNPDMVQVVAIAGWNAIIAAGITPSDDLFNQLNVAAASYAEDRAAQLVSEVSDTTRDSIRRALQVGLEENLSIGDIATSLEQSFSFSSGRAALIAQTEVGNANGAGALEGLQTASAAGVPMRKQWVLGGEGCPICDANADAGAIPLDEAFPSGDDAPLAHPNCLCVLIGVSDEE